MSNPREVIDKHLSDAEWFDRHPAGWRVRPRYPDEDGPAEYWLVVPRGRRQPAAAVPPFVEPWLAATDRARKALWAEYVADWPVSRWRAADHVTEAA